MGMPDAYRRLSVEFITRLLALNLRRCVLKKYFIINVVGDERRLEPLFDNNSFLSFIVL